MPTRTVVLTDHQEALIETLVKEGRYQNANEVLDEGLRLLEQREAADRTKLKVLRDAVQLGLDDLDAGLCTEFSSPEELERYLRERAERILAERRR